MFSFSVPANRNKAEDLDRYIDMIARGDGTGLNELYKRTKSAVYGFILSLVRDFQDAEDVTQDCYVSVYVNAAAYVSEKKPMAWILTIARNLSLKKLNEKRRTTPIGEEEIERYYKERAMSAGNIAEDRFFLSEILNGLTDEEREILILHAVAGLKHRETAKILGIPLPTALSKYNRAVKKLQKKYGSRTGVL